MKVVLFGLPYSPNVGDGVIADCLAEALRTRLPDAEVICVDLSGRTGWGAVTVRNREAILKILGRLPRGLRHRIVLNRLGALLDRAEPAWRAVLEGADLAVIGGGQLFSDADLNFPAKVQRAARLAARARVPIAIHAVGVAANWSRKGRELFGAVLDADLRQVAVRDANSAEAWRAQMAGNGPAPIIGRDPGLLAAACYGAKSAGEAVGVCISAPELLQYHAEAGVAGGGTDFWAGVAGELVTAGHPVRLFCNGAAEDRAALSRLAGHPGMATLIGQGTVTVAPAPETSSVLAAEIGSLRAVVAHRLHACILAYAFQRPAIGLGWDRKVESFFDSIGQPDWFVGREDADAHRIAERLTGALRTGVNPEVHARVLSETEASIDKLVRLISAHHAT